MAPRKATAPPTATSPRLAPTREAFSDISVLARSTSCLSRVLDSCVSSFNSWPMVRSSLRSAAATAMAHLILPAARHTAWCRRWPGRSHRTGGPGTSRGSGRGGAARGRPEGRAAAGGLGVAGPVAAVVAKIAALRLRAGRLEEPGQHQTRDQGAAEEDLGAAAREILGVAHEVPQVAVTQVGREPLDLLGGAVGVLAEIAALLAFVQLAAGLAQRAGQRAQAVGRLVLLLPDERLHVIARLVGHVLRLLRGVAGEALGLLLGVLGEILVGRKLVLGVEDGGGRLAASDICLLCHRDLSF